MNGITEIWEAVNSKAGEFFEWAQANPKISHLLGVILIAFWLTGCCCGGNGRASGRIGENCGFFDDCKPKTKRRIYIVLLSTILILCLIDLFFLWSEG